MRQIYFCCDYGTSEADPTSAQGVREDTGEVVRLFIKSGTPSGIVRTDHNTDGIHWIRTDIESLVLTHQAVLLLLQGVPATTAFGFGRQHILLAMDLRDLYKMPVVVRNLTYATVLKVPDTIRFVDLFGKLLPHVLK